MSLEKWTFDTLNRSFGLVAWSTCHGAASRPSWPWWRARLVVIWRLASRSLRRSLDQHGAIGQPLTQKRMNHHEPCVQRLRDTKGWQFFSFMKEFPEACREHAKKTNIKKTWFGLMSPHVVHCTRVLVLRTQKQQAKKEEYVIEPMKLTVER